MLEYLNAPIFECPITGKFKLPNDRALETSHLRAVECVKNQFFEFSMFLDVAYLKFRMIEKSNFRMLGHLKALIFERLVT